MSGYIGEDVQRMFLFWISLNHFEIQRWNSFVMDTLNENHLRMYQELIHAFFIWNDVQNTIGAPGLCGDFPTNVEIEAEVSNLMHAMDIVWRLHKAKCSTESNFPTNDQVSLMTKFRYHFAYQKHNRPPIQAKI